MRETERIAAAARAKLEALSPWPVPDDLGDYDPAPSPQRRRALMDQSGVAKRAPRRTSAAALKGTEPDADDPLLGFAPVPHKQLRGNSIGPDKQRKFIAALAATGIVTEAALAVGKSTEALYALRNRPGAGEFRAAWDTAIDRGVARLESCALQRAIEGEERMVVSGGKLIGFETRHNDALVMFFLRQRRPERFGSSGKFDDLRPGHPLYERLRAEWEADARREDPERTQRLHASIDAKVRVWRMELERHWEEERRQLIEDNGGAVPVIDSFAQIPLRYDDEADSPGGDR